MTRAIPQDALAGLLLAAIAIPEQLATARLAGMPPEAGLFAFVAGTAGFALFGTNRFLSAGADSTIAPIFASGLAVFAIAGTPDYAALAALLAAMVGVVLIAAAVLRAGWIADLLSIPVVTGFLAGIAVHIVIGQLPSVLGVAGAAGSLVSQAAAMWHALPRANPIAIGIGAFVLLTTRLTERLMPRLPGALLSVGLAAVATAAFDLRGRGIDVVGALSVSLPHPPIGLLHPADVLRLLPLTLIVALVCMVQTAAVLRAFPSQPDGPRHVARDFGGVGAGNILAAALGSFAVDASPPRTAVVVQAGGTSQLAGVVAVAITVALLLGGSGMFAFVPHAALAGLLLAVALRLFRLREMLRILHYGGLEILQVGAAAVLVIALPIQEGVFAAIVLSLLQSFYGVARPLCVELVRAAGTTVWWPPNGEHREEHVPGVLVFAPSAPLNFTNAAFVRTRLAQAIAGAAAPVRLVVIEASGIIDIDYTGSLMLQHEIAALRERGIEVALARLSSERAQAQARRAGLLDALGAEHVFLSVEDAVQRRSAAGG
ncbi:MAG TPA: SulP family inorganic anion transporter [Acetobacteraceae bacterium]|jgi:MFS superfamily sulfate permease-like transporter